ncbi:uncharacterized protein GGS22DRAFT_58248 [Annulohypoxylon maeteangense]|uniref:uncharacterized protein n=1 Tax=Annulohypoxylon maeteangense TaxID=1927788 RepID=UPI002007A438|nr:uncharacterized protein GGS22DRAFT_58248 [Annulohypoxylon maeteangense]KAI0881455.1 hypothetical protein GGS22DRAFT_58248 [Annulohypoxylon maeteangense]
MLSSNILKTVTLLAAAAPAVNAHSWVEQVRQIDLTGAFTGNVGYPIGYMNRSAPNFNDSLAQNKILNTATNPAVCKPKAGAYDKVNRLSAAAGDYVALIYQENGHVTQPNLTPRPYRDGIVNVYGTLNHQDSDGINDVLNSWTADGKGGNGKGKLLGTHYYDDGQCYQNAGHNFAIPIYASRFHEHGLEELYCQTDFQLPEDLPDSGTYTVMWVWDWPLITTDTQNTTEIYTSCAEIELGPAKNSAKNAQVKYAGSNKIQSAGIASQLATQFEATGLGIGTHAPLAGPSSAATSAVATSASAEPTSSSTKKHKGHQGGVTTVTVTAAAMTTTAWKTVTIDAAGSGKHHKSSAVASASVGQASSSASASASSSALASAGASSTGSSSAAPTTVVPVSTISKFLRARATGQARRDDQS